MITTQQTKWTSRLHSGLVKTVAIIALFVLAGGAQMAKAQTLLYSDAIAAPSNGIGTTGLNSYTFGLSFTITSSINVTALGIWDENQEALLASHQIGLWSSTGTLLAEATVGSGTSNTLVADTGAASANGYRFALTLDDGSDSPISSLTLAPGTYTLGMQQEGNEPYQNGYGSITMAAGVTDGGGHYSGASFSDPTGGSTPVGYRGPDLEFTEAPEPRAALLMGIGAMALVLIRYRRSKLV